MQPTPSQTRILLNPAHDELALGPGVGELAGGRLLVWPAARGHGATVAGEGAMLAVTRPAFLVGSDAAESRKTALATLSWMRRLVLNLLS